MEKNLSYYLAFNLCWEVVGPVRFQQLLRYYKSVERAWKAPPQDLLRLGWSAEAVRKLYEIKKKVDLKTEMDRASTKDVRLITWESADYPENLRRIPDPPFLLYVRGCLEPRDSLALAVVGSRKMTNYGSDVTQMLVGELAASGLTIVSGLAFGVDCVAHRSALAAGGRAIAVLASGVDKITPRSNESLAREIIERGRGAIVSEFPLGTEPKNFFFPFRNRIISGLSLAVLVTEAAEKSGTFHTVKAALDQGREVFAVPGPIYNPLSRGPLKLIKDGAKMACSAEDILAELEVRERLQAERAKIILPENPLEEEVLRVLASGEKHLDLIVRSLSLPTGRVASLLTGMELKGMVRDIGGGVYRKS